MDNKSELSKPVAWAHRPEINAPIDVTENEYVARNWRDVHERNVQPLYSQEYVSALLAELEAKKQEHRVHAARLISERGVLRERIAELEKRLATPVRLPTREFYDDPLSAHLAIKDCANAIRVAGFIIDAGNGEPEEETPLAKMARIIRENPHPTNECDMLPEEGDE
ncbi:MULTISPECIES: hypothetical protein [Serratia]|uniref:Ead/Ea22-like family protein n=1 Tax=Serratia marcescens TaxID=615 RepID=A0A6H2ZWI3_SERMA|nr:hypothetical protein [Serratia marcescens]OCO80410.1 hypothetical protein AN695_0205885 [Serratia marcescens]